MSKSEHRNPFKKTQSPSKQVKPGSVSPSLTSQCTGPARYVLTGYRNKPAMAVGLRAGMILSHESQQMARLLRQEPKEASVPSSFPRASLCTSKLVHPGVQCQPPTGEGVTVEMEHPTCHP